MTYEEINNVENTEKKANDQIEKSNRTVFIPKCTLVGSFHPNLRDITVKQLLSRQCFSTRTDKALFYPIVIEGLKNKILTKAAITTGSDSSFIERWLLEFLGVPQKKIRLKIRDLFSEADCDFHELKISTPNFTSPTPFYFGVLVDKISFHYGCEMMLGMDFIRFMQALGISIL